MEGVITFFLSAFFCFSSALLASSLALLSEQVTQYQSPLGISSKGGSKQSMWKDKGQPSQSKSFSSLSPEPHFTQRISSTGF